ncbi:hypothetical protein QUF58_04255 [Anaerolineales bacterium HSG24]|nr:hypothetical protein [Anaerolineales bacterium HSG24]
MATRHGLQHIKLLYEAINTVNQRRQVLRDDLVTMQKTVLALQEKLNRWQARLKKLDQFEERLTSHLSTVSQLQADVDSLKQCLETHGIVVDSAKK